jgi:hypothetical protein
MGRRSDKPTRSAYERALYRRISKQRAKAVRKGDEPEAERLGRVLDDPELFGVVAETVCNDAGIEEDTLDIAFYAMPGESNVEGEIKLKPKAIGDGTFLARLMEFLQWIMANWAEISKMIAAIVVLFDEPPKKASELRKPGKAGR